MLSSNVDLPPKDPARPRLVHLTTTDMSLDWLLGPQLRAFAAAGYEVIGMSAAGPHVGNLERMGIAHVGVRSLTRSSSPVQDVKACIEIVRLLRRVRPDVLHTHNPKPGIIGRVAGRLVGVPLVVNTQHGLYAQSSDRWQRRLPVYLAERLAAAFSHVELVQSPEDVETLVSVLKVSPRKVHLLGNGIDLRRFERTSDSAHARERIRSEWDVAPHEVVVGAVGRLVREKGVGELLEAAALLESAGSKVRLVVIGPADLDKSDAIAAGVVERATRDGVVFTGQRVDMAECYSAMDLFVTASWREGFPRSAMEAAAMGLPTVATDVRGNRHVVVDDVTGVLVPVRDARALASAIEELSHDEDRRHRLGAAARERALTCFDQRDVIELTLRAYRSGLCAASSDRAGGAGLRRGRRDRG